jgi:molybdopterin-guanine dinucleotide biosynthesis protein A
MWTAAILAGGRSRRLGGLNKARLVLNAATSAPGASSGDSVLDRQLMRLVRVVDRTIIIANDAEAYSRFGVPVIADLIPGAGALGALYTAVHTAQTDRTLVVACDMPFVSEPLLAYLVDAGRSADIAIPRTTRGYEPLCATYSRRSAGELLRLIEEKRFKLGDVARIPGLIVREIGRDELDPFGPEEVLFFNINTPDDYARAIELDGAYHTPPQFS